MPLVILGRDGVINQRLPSGVSCPEEWQPLPGNLEAITRLNHAGYKVAVATEQPGLKTGAVDLDTLNAIHARLHQQLNRVGGHVDAIFVCPGDSNDNTDCGQEKPALLSAICERFNNPSNDVIVISDELEDLQAADMIGAKPLWIRHASSDSDAVFPCFDDLNHTVEHLLKTAS